MLFNNNFYNFSFDEKTKNEPIALEVTFWAKNKKIYQYGFEIKNKNIVSEWLYVKKINKVTPIFNRDENKVKFNKSYKAKINKFDVDSSSLFLSLYRKIEKDNEDFKSVYDWFLNSYYLDLGNPKFENKINRLISPKVYGQVWVVFDKDDYTDEQFNNAIKLNEYNSAWSNPNFEVWLLSL